MAFVTVNAPSGSLNLTVFPREYREYRRWIKADITENSRGIAINALTPINF